MSVLEAEGITAGYGRSTVLRQVDLSVAPGSVTALLGPNGAGKTTLLRVLAGTVRPSRGTVRLDGTSVTGKAPNVRVRGGLCLVPEGRGIFRALRVRDNLTLNRPPWLDGPDVEKILEIFPALRDKLEQPAGRLSGGQQQMVALSRAFLAEPKVVLLDEVSMGLAPLIVDQIFDALQLLTQTGTALLIVEQYVARVLDVADSVYLMNRGSIVFKGTPAELDHDEVVRGYLGSSVDNAAHG